MVWIHGGGNTVGSGTQPRINGEHLARRGDVVVVTLNYRLGAFGFLHMPEIGATGNETLLDQVAGLRWVRDEIANFGGDPNNVTVFGQSAGGFDIVQLMAMPAAAGCFDKVIPMSGSLLSQIPADESAAVAARYREHFAVDDSAALRDVPAESILELQQELSDLRWGPVLDGDLIKEDAAGPIGRGDHTQGMPLLIGNCRDEWNLFTATNEAYASFDDARLLDETRAKFGERSEEGLAVYREPRAANPSNPSPSTTRSAPTRCSVGPPFAPPSFTPRTRRRPGPISSATPRPPSTDGSGPATRWIFPSFGAPPASTTCPSSAAPAQTPMPSASA